MAKTRTVFEEIKYLKGKIQRTEKACKDLESKIPEAEKRLQQVESFEHSEDSNERKVYIYTAYDLASLRSELTKKRTDMFFDKERLEELLQLKQEVESSMLQPE